MVIIWIVVGVAAICGVIAAVVGIVEVIDDFREQSRKKRNVALIHKAKRSPLRLNEFNSASNLVEAKIWPEEGYQVSQVVVNQLHGFIKNQPKTKMFHRRVKLEYFGGEWHKAERR